MWFQDGKVWNSIARNKVPYDDSIYIFKRKYKNMGSEWINEWITYKI